MRRLAVLVPVLFLLAATLVPGAAPARELFRRGEVSLELTGSIRQIVVATQGTDASRFDERLAGNLPDLTCLEAVRFADCPAFDITGRRDVWQSLTRVRTQWDLRAGPRVSARVVYDHELLAGILDTFDRQVGQGIATDAFFDLDDDVDLFGIQEEGSRVRWRHLLYRAFVHVETERVEAVIGRQRIPWGVGRLWNPIDRFNAIPPLAIEGDQSPGIDAVDLKIRASGFTFLELAWAPQDGTNDLMAARWHGVAGDADYSLVAGWFEETWTFGADFATNLKDAALRIEAVYADPSRQHWPLGRAAPVEVDAYFQAVVSLDYNFDLGTGLYVLVEHFYNGNATGFGRGRAGTLEVFFESTSEAPPGLPEPPLPFLPPISTGPFVTRASADRFAGNRVITAAKNQTGLQAGYDLTPILRADFLALYDWNGDSAAFFPSLTWSPTGNLELVGGAQLFVGKKLSQYGDAERLFFLRAEWFF